MATRREGRGDKMRGIERGHEAEGASGRAPGGVGGVIRCVRKWMLERCAVLRVDVSACARACISAQVRRCTAARRLWGAMFATNELTHKAGGQASRQPDWPTTERRRIGRVKSLRRMKR
eukprot:5868674-Pleurochrysis_carterae.AAC.4